MGGGDKLAIDKYNLSLLVSAAAAGRAGGALMKAW
jgi:hypothetical protein